MHPDTARWLISDEGAEYLAEDLDPDSLADAERLRRRLHPERAAAVLSQVALRRRARAKFGAAAAMMFFTPDTLEQATRPAVAAWRASRFVSAGVTRVVDLGCGIGSDAQAMIAAGLDVRAVEVDEVTAIFARANLGSPIELADATSVGIGPGEAVFIDPARRTAAGRTWNVADFSPSWEFVTSILKGRIACLKLGPGVPYELLPPEASTCWISDHGDVVEASVWSGTGQPGSRSALLLPDGIELSIEPRTSRPDSKRDNATASQVGGEVLRVSLTSRGVETKPTSHTGNGLDDLVGSGESTGAIGEVKTCRGGQSPFLTEESPLTIRQGPRPLPAPKPDSGVSRETRLSRSHGASLTPDDLTLRSDDSSLSQSGEMTLGLDDLTQRRGGPRLGPGDSIPGLGGSVKGPGDSVPELGGSVPEPGSCVPRRGDLILEPDGAIIRAGLVDALAYRLGATRLHPGIAYLTLAPDEQIILPNRAKVPEQLIFGDEQDYLLIGRAVTWFQVLEVLPFSEKVLKAWVRKNGVGRLEIKKRGIEVDPATLRKRLRPKGDVSATIVLAPTVEGARIFSVIRLGRSKDERVGTR